MTASNVAARLMFLQASGNHHFGGRRDQVTDGLGTQPEDLGSSG